MKTGEGFYDRLGGKEYTRSHKNGALATFIDRFC